ncbi:hypothetical protein ACFWUW_29780 [Streptomyces sp. NPDC058655]|uniref:hypothetical protein n=1 Tax=Streptomyces sp. NPDC058655 TaxID=3346577 RepID=UPI0036657896
MIITHDIPSLLLAAARNNAEWCDAVCRAHGLTGTFTADAWSSARRTPPLYPDAVTLTRGGTPEAALAAGIDTRSPGCTVKDSFAALDLGPEGFEVLFEAQWIHRPAGAAPVTAGPSPQWSPVAGAGELAEWEAAWGGGEEAAGLFRPSLLTAETLFLTGRVEGRIAAGAVAHRSGSVVGVSNLFAHDDAPVGAVWAGVLTAVAARWPGLPVVGYESGDDLDAALRAGFTTLGPLRIWIRTGGDASAGR